MKETIQDSKNGYLYHELNEDALYKKIKLLESLDNHEYQAMKKNARSSAEKYSFENFKKQILEFVNSKTHHNHNA